MNQNFQILYHLTVLDPDKEKEEDTDSYDEF